MTQSATSPRTDGAPAIHDMAAMAWTEAGKSGLYQKVVYADMERGKYLGLIRFDPEVRSGLHQHQGVATSYFLAGSLTDFGGSAVQGQAGINLRGDTHDAVSYDGCLLASRLEAPVVYPEDAETLHRLHTGATRSAFLEISPEIRPDINVTVADLREIPTSIAHVSRQTIFDYAPAETDHRFVTLRLQPGAEIPGHRNSAAVDWFVLAGDVEVGGATAYADCFVTARPSDHVAARSRAGCYLLAWAEGPVDWADAALPDLYGF